MIPVYYVTGTHPSVHGGKARVELGKFFSVRDANNHMKSLQAPEYQFKTSFHYDDLRVEERQEEVSAQHEAHQDLAKAIEEKLHGRFNPSPSFRPQ